MQGWQWGEAMNPILPSKLGYPHPAYVHVLGMSGIPPGPAMKNKALEHWSQHDLDFGHVSRFMSCLVHLNTRRNFCPKTPSCVTSPDHITQFYKFFIFYL